VGWPSSEKVSRPERGVLAVDPLRLGELEARAWSAYYRRRWPAMLLAIAGLVRESLRLSTRHTVYGAWLVIRANQVWAPYPRNDPDAARAYMARFYRMLARAHPGAFGPGFDPVEAARLDVAWWTVHRRFQRESPPGADAEPLVDALAALAAHVFGVPARDVRPAAQARAEAMLLSDRWVAGGCRHDDDTLAGARAALVRSYAALLTALHR
jgi:hypothetical protein